MNNLTSIKLPKRSNSKLAIDEIILKEDEATKLAEKLKSQLQTGKSLEADEKQIERLIAGLGDRRGLIRRTFAESLGVIGTSAVPALCKALLRHPNVIVRRAAAKTLKLVGDPSALPDLLKALMNDDDPVVQCSSAGAMAIFGERAVQHFLKVLANPNSSAMQCGLASWGLSFVGAEAPKALREAAQSKNPLIKAASIAALGEQIQSLQDKTAKRILLQALDDPDIEVRAEATILLGRLSNSNWVISLLIKRLNDPSSGVRKNAALALMKLQVVDAINELKKLLIKEEDADVINILKLAIKQLNQSA